MKPMRWFISRRPWERVIEVLVAALVATGVYFWFAQHVEHRAVICGFAAYLGVLIVNRIINRFARSRNRTES
jgi:hypothetical protein